MTTKQEALDQIAGYLNWTEDEFHLEVPQVRRHLRAILAEVTPEAGYEQGYRDGGNNVLVDWRIAWEEHGPEGEVPSFSEAAKRLTEVPPEPGGVLDRDQAREVLIEHDPWTFDDPPQFDETLLDRLAGCVRPAAIDRDALEAIWPWHWNQEERDTFTNKVLALVRPAGVTLTPEDRALLAKASRKWANAVEQSSALAELTDDQFAQVFSDEPDRLRALAARLEADGQAGFVLTLEEVDFVLGWKAFCEISEFAPGFTTAERALAARLEAWETENDPHTERDGNAPQG